MIRRFNSNLNASGIVTAPSGIFANLEVSNSLTVSGIPVTAGTGGGGGGSPLTVKEVDGSPSVSNVTTIRVSNSSLTNDGGGQVTISTGGSTGDIVPVNISGTSMSYFEPNAPPATGTSIDDEFDQNPFQKFGNANRVPIGSKWTLFDPGAITSGTSVSHGIFIDGFHWQHSPGAAADTGAAYWQNLPTHVSWQVAARVGISPTINVASNQRIGLILANDTLTSDPTNADFVTLTLKITTTDDQWNIAYEEWTDYNSPNTTNIRQDIMEAIPAANENAVVLHANLILRLGWRASDNRIDATYSFDGINFKDVQSSLTAHPLTNPPTKVGIFKASGSSSVAAGTVSWFRMVDNEAFFRNAPVYGRRIPLSGTVGIPDVLTTVSGAFSQSLTISGVPVSTGTGGGAGTITGINNINSGAVTITGAGTVAVTTVGNTITVSGSQSSLSTTFSGVRYDPMITPEFPSPFDDEFEVGRFNDNGKWTFWDSDSRGIAQTYAHNWPGLLRTNTSGIAGGDDDWSGVFQTAPNTASSWSVDAKISMNSLEWDAVVSVGIMLGQNLSGAPTTSDFYSLVLRNNVAAPDTRSVIFRTHTDYTDGVGTTLGAEHSFAQAPGNVFLRLTWQQSTTEVHGLFSFDGIDWRSINEDPANFTPAQIGILSQNARTATSAQGGSVEFFRVVTTDNAVYGHTADSRTRPLFGRSVHVITSGTTNFPLPSTISVNSITAVTGTFTSGVTIGSSTVQLDTDRILAPVGTFTQSLTVSGVPVSTGTNFMGVLLRNSSDQFIADNTTVTMDFEEIYDQGGWHTPTAGPTVSGHRIVIPAGVSIASFHGQGHFVTSGTPNGTTSRVTTRIRKNGGTIVPDSLTTVHVNAANAATIIGVSVPPTRVVPGDYFTFEMGLTSVGTNAGSDHFRTIFSAKKEN